MQKSTKKLLVVILMLIFVAGSAFAVSASPAALKMTAYPGVKIIYNGQEVTGSNQPYIINDVTFVPFRLLMESFGKNVTWDAENYQVIIADGSTSTSKEMELYTQLADLQNQNKDLQKTITSLKTELAAAESASDDTSVSDIESALDDSFADAGDEYFSDDGIKFSFNLSGDEDDLVYTITMDFDQADDYETITAISTSQLENFLGDIRSKIRSEIDGTDFEDADITGKLIDDDASYSYISYNGSSYSYSWSDTDISDIREGVTDYLSALGVGEYYFSDDGIVVSINVSGDADELAYTIAVDCSGSDSGYDCINDLSSSTLKTFLDELNTKISSEISNTSFEDADLTGYLYDLSNSSYYIEYNNGSYSVSW